MGEPLRFRFLQESVVINDANAKYAAAQQAGIGIQHGDGIRRRRQKGIDDNPAMSAAAENQARRHACNAHGGTCPQ